MIDFKKSSILMSILLIVMICMLLLSVYGCASAPVKDDFDLSEAFDKAICSHYSKDKKLFGTSTHNVLECVKESDSLSSARKEDRAYKRIKYCSVGFKKKGFETIRECTSYINQK